MAAPIEPDDKRSAASNSQLRFFQFATLTLAVLLAALAGYYEYRQHTLLPVTLLVDGKPVATVQSITTAASVIQAVHAQKVGPEFLQKDNPRFKEDVEFQTVSGQTDIDSFDAAEAKLAAATHTVVDADVILVDNKPVVAFPDAHTAQAAVDELRDHYVSMPPDAPLTEKPTFIQNVTIERKTVPASLTRRSADEGAVVMWTPPPAKVYTVHYGETGWIIANKFKISLSDFLRANAGHDVNRLKPGDLVNVSKTFAPIDVIVKKQLNYTQKFGGTGVRQVTEIATYMDGVEVGAPLATNMVTLQRATPRYSLN